MITLFQLWWSFCQIGFTSFGGLSMIPLINSEMVSHSWMSASEVSDIVAIAEMTPGPLGLNCATFAGMRIAGVLGAIASNLGMLAPTFTVCALAAVFFERFQNSSVLKQIMMGVRPVCLGIIVAVLITLSRSNYWLNGAPAFHAIAYGVVALVALLRFNWSVPKVIVLCAALGMLFG